MLAASAGHVEAFTELLRKGAAIDVEGKERQTVLHLAAEENHIQILQVCHAKLYRDKDAWGDVPLSPLLLPPRLFTLYFPHDSC